jgi:hypothetical protein
MPRGLAAHFAVSSSRASVAHRAYGPDLLRAAAILLVMAWHLPQPVRVGFIGDIRSFGWIGVDIFFVLSGYLIGTPLLKTVAARRPLDPSPLLGQPRLQDPAGLPGGAGALFSAARLQRRRGAEAAVALPDLHDESRSRLPRDRSLHVGLVAVRRGALLLAAAAAGAGPEKDQGASRRR